MFTPQSYIKLCNVPMNDNKNQLHFASRELQYNYFNSLSGKVYNDFTYLRQDTAIKVTEEIDKLYQYNYVIYKNDNFSDKLFFAFIQKLEYVSPACTKVYIKTDVIQTWHFDYNVLPSFTVREHVANDTIGTHLVDEGLSTGEIVTANYQQVINAPCSTHNEIDNNYYIICLTSTAFSFGGMPYPLISNNLQAIFVYGTTRYNFTAMLDEINKAINSCIGLWLVPKVIIDNIAVKTTYSGNPNIFCFETCLGDLGYKPYQFTNLTGAFLKDYTPKNNKLLTYPYCYLEAESGNGDVKKYRYEFFDDFPTIFNIDFSLGANASLCLYPLNYKGRSKATDNAIMCHTLQQITFGGDAFKQYMYLNQNQIQARTVTTAFSSLSSSAGALAQGNVLGAVDGMSGIYNELSRQQDLEKMPNETKGSANSLIQSASGTSFFRLVNRSITPEFAKIIDDFFSMFGYKVNTVKIPEHASRQNWNYIETRDININGNVPQADIDEIKNVYNSGFTFWHNPENFCNYSVSNNIR